MSLAVDVASEGVRPALGKARVADIVRTVLRAEKVKDAMVSVAFVGADAMATLNARHLGHRGPTDVISFGFAPTGADGAVVGDIYICPQVARDNARDAGVGVREELARLVVHGTLHVLGHDHPEDESRLRSPMWRRQEQLLRRVLGPRA